MPTTFAIFALLSLGSVPGCTSFHPSVGHTMDIRQGGVLSEDAIAALTPGTTKTQVESLLGPPSIQDTFHPNRWDYVYSLEKGGKPCDLKRVTLYFKDDLLDRIER